MRFNPQDGSGLVDEINSLCDSDSTSYPIATKTRRLNSSLEEVVGWLINADGMWQFDDENYTTIPEGTTTLVVGQSDYSFSNTFLDIEWIKIKNSGGQWQFIYAVDQSQTNIPLEDYLIANGFPQFYDKLGDTLRLYPAPDSSVTLSAGMKVGFKRTASLFTKPATEATVDTTVPGFASPYHVILAYMASVPFCETYHPDRVMVYQAKILQLKLDLISFYSRRAKDTRKFATTKRISHR